MARTKLIDRITGSRPYQLVRQWTKKRSFPGFEGIPIYSVFDFIRAELHKDNILIRANAMAFSFFLALFPSIIVLITLLPYLPIRHLTEALQESIRQLLPTEAALYITEVIDSLTTVTNSGLLSVSAFLALWFASNGMMTMLRGFEKNYHVSYEKRGTIAKRWTALKITFIIGGLFITSMVFIVFGRFVLDTIDMFIEMDDSRYYSILIVRWVAMFFLFYAGISVTYRYGPSIKRRIRFLSPGATLATILSLATSVLFSYYLSKFNRYNELYGSLGALIILMLWIQLNSLIILIGYELNASIKVNKDMSELINGESDQD